jgi:hypothetical protein
MVKKMFFLLLACAVLFPAGLSAQEPNTFTRYEGERITGIAASSAFEVVLVRSAQTKAVVEISPELEPHLDLSLDRGIVRVGLQKNNGLKLALRRNDLTAKITVYLNELSRVETSGAVRLLASGDFTSGHTDLRLSGASRITGLDLSTKTLTIDGSGASSISLTAKAEDASVDFSGAGKGRLELKCREADISCTSASKLELTGGAQQADMEVTSAARIDAYGFEVRRLDAEATSASSLRVWVTESFDAEASSAAAIRYRGNPDRRELHSSSATTIRRVD